MTQDQSKQTTVALHPTVQQLAASFTWDHEQLTMSDQTRALWENKLATLKDPAEKKLVLVSLVALGARYSREAKGNTQQAKEALMKIAAAVIGDPDKARSLFEA